MTPREFLEVVVAPNINDFHSNFADMRHAHNAINTVDALAAHLYVWATENNPNAVADSKCDSAYRAKLAASDKDFALLRDIAKAQRHVRLEKANPQVKRADQVTSRSIEHDGRARYDGGFRHGDQVGSISPERSVLSRAF